VVSKYFADGSPGSKSDRERAGLRNDVAAADLAQELVSYPDCYLEHDQVTDTRIVETIQRMQETLYGKADVSLDLHAVIQCGQAIEVPAARTPRGQGDPLMDELSDRLSAMLAQLSREARPIAHPDRQV
jgi:hypothetical protein